MEEHLISKHIVERLSTADGQTYAMSGITVNDFNGKMWLDSGKGELETTVLSMDLMDAYEGIITIDSDIL